MKAGWAIKRLVDLSDLITKGKTPTSVGHAFVPEGIPVNVSGNRVLSAENVPASARNRPARNAANASACVNRRPVRSAVRVPVSARRKQRSSWPTARNALSST